MTADVPQENTVIPRPAEGAEATYRHSKLVTPAARLAHFEAVAGTDADPLLIDGRSGASWRSMNYRWKRWERYCAAAGLPPLPATADRLQAFVRACLSEGTAPASVQVLVSAVSVVARLRGSSADASLTREHLRSARRRHGAQKRARPLLASDLAAILLQCAPDDPRAVRDAATLALGFAVASRSGELTGLDLERASSTETGATGVLCLEPRSILVRWSRTKTSQANHVEVEVLDDDLPELRVWLERWLTLADIRPGTPLLRPITKARTIVSARLDTSAITGIVRRRIMELEIARGRSPFDAAERASHFSGHSMRRGYVTSATAAGVAFAEIRARSRHADDAALARYIGEQQGRRHGGLKGLVPKGDA